MAYVIYVDWSKNNDEIENITTNYITSNNEFLMNIDEFKYFCENIDNIDKEDYINKFKESDAFCALLDRCAPMFSDVHILQSPIVTNEQIKTILKFVPDVNIMYFNDLKTYGIAINVCGIDIGDSIEFAYLVIDGVSPFKVKHRLSISEEAWNLLIEMRNKF